MIEPNRRITGEFKDKIRAICCAYSNPVSSLAAPSRDEIETICHAYSNIDIWQRKHLSARECYAIAKKRLEESFNAFKVELDMEVNVTWLDKIFGAGCFSKAERMDFLAKWNIRDEASWNCCCHAPVRAAVDRLKKSLGIVSLYDIECREVLHYIDEQLHALREKLAVEDVRAQRRALRKRRFVMAMKIAYFLCVAVITVIVGVEENSIWSCLGVVIFSGVLYSWMAGKSRQSGRRSVRR